jgi:methionyl-tRNA synthetase
VTALNRAIDERKPWTLAKEGREHELDALLYDVSEGLRWLAILLHPFMPERTAQMWEQLGLDPAAIAEDWTRALQWGGLPEGTQTAVGDALFPRIELVESA